MDEKHEKMKKHTEKFFKEAFCAESAEQLLGEDLSNFRESGILKITTNDNREDFYIAVLKRI